MPQLSKILEAGVSIGLYYIRIVLCLVGVRALVSINSIDPSASIAASTYSKVFTLAPDP